MSDQTARQKAEDHYYAALDQVAAGEPEHALAEYKQSLEADPTFTETMHGMARILQDLQGDDSRGGGRSQQGAHPWLEAAVEG